MKKWNEKSWGIFINLIIALAIVICGTISAKAQTTTCADITYNGINPNTCEFNGGSSGSPCVTIDGLVPNQSYIGTFLTFQWQNNPVQTLKITGVVPMTGTPNMNLQSTTCTPTAITELELNTNNDGKMYDLLGREVNEIEIGTMYIQNRKLYIKK